MLLLPLLVVAVVYVTILAYVYFFQNRFIYYPTDDFAVLPDQVGLSCEDVWIDVSPTEQINGWYIAGRPDKRTVLFLHGNGGNIGHRLPHLQFLQSLGVSVLIIDYRGYGRSKGKPSEENFYADASASYQWIVKTKGVGPDRIILFGESIGGGVAANLAATSPCAGLILESSFTSIGDMARRVFAFLPTGLLLRSKYNTLEKLGKLTCPVLVTHSPEDDIVPFEMGQKLYAEAKPPKAFVRLYGGHNDRDYVNQPEYRQAVEAFLNDPAATR
jgi:fermentation-respiration switch protein FrsA (DUF1100 family)